MARLISKQQLEEIRFRNDIADVIGSYFSLQRAGANFKALCPFHKEKTPSFHINTQRQSFHCFGCGAGGDVFGFIMQQEAVDFMTAAKMLAERVNIQLELEEGEAGSAGDKALLYRIHEEVSHFFERCLLEMRSAAQARAYLASRDLDGDIRSGFRIGFAPNRWDSILRWGDKHGFAAESLETAGLIVRNERPDARSPFYDRFRNRLMFPIRDEQARVIGFSGRTLESGGKLAKYVNSPETPLFHKSRILYALDQARKPIVEAGEAIVCEGQIDVIRCHQHGVVTAVAAQGTAFTEEHARILRRYADSVVIMFDPDTAGQDAAIRAASVFVTAGLAVRVATLPEGQDPDVFIRERGVKALRAVVDAAASVVAFQIAVLGGRENLSSEVGAMRAARAVLETIRNSPNAVQRAKLVQEAAERLRIPVTALQDDLRFVMSRTRRPREEESRVETPAAEAAPPREEIELCEHLTHAPDHPEVAELVQDYLPLALITDAMCRRVAAACLEAFETGGRLHDVLEAPGDVTAELLAFAVRVQEAPSKIRGTDYSHADAVRDIILRLWRRKRLDERARLAAAASGPDAGTARARYKQITLDIDALKNWAEGAELIEVELAE